MSNQIVIYSHCCPSSCAVSNQIVICSHCCPSSCAVSNQIVAEDVQNLRAGLEDVKAEKEKEPDNFILFISSLILFKHPSMVAP